MLALLLVLGLSVAPAATFERPADLAEITDRSEAVLQGVVVLAEARPAPHGLETAYTIVVDDVLRGRDRDEVTVVLPGGRLDGLVQRFDGVPLWDEGDEVVVFVPEDGRVSLRGLLTVDGDRIVDPLRRPAVPTRLDALVAAVVERGG